MKIIKKRIVIFVIYILSRTELMLHCRKIVSSKAFLISENPHACIGQLWMIETATPMVP